MKKLRHCHRMCTFARNMVANNRTQLVLSHDNNITVSNGQQPAVTSVCRFALSCINLTLCY